MEKRRTILRWSSILAAWIVGLTFIYAGLTKIVAMPEVSFVSGSPQLKIPESGIRLLPAQDFAKAISNYKLLPGFLERAMAATLPWIEIAAGLAMFTRRFRYEGALAITGLLVIFIIALTHAIRNNLDIACGCFSVSQRAHKLGWNTLFFDIELLVIMAIVIFWMETERRRLKREKQTNPSNQQPSI